jgi:hypothetical protein
VHATLKGNEVGLDAATADEPKGAKAVEATEVVDNVTNLLGKFAGWHKYDRLDFVDLGVDDACEGKPEGDRLAAAGLGEADEVFILKEDREGGGLDRARLGVPEGGDCGEAGLIDTEGAERFGDWGEGRERGAVPRGGFRDGGELGFAAGCAPAAAAAAA